MSRICWTQWAIVGITSAFASGAIAAGLGTEVIGADLRPAATQIRSMIETERRAEILRMASSPGGNFYTPTESNHRQSSSLPELESPWRNRSGLLPSPTDAFPVRKGELPDSPNGAKPGLSDSPVSRDRLT